MELLQDCQSVDQWYDMKSNDGRFVCESSTPRNWMTADETAALPGIVGFEAEPDPDDLYGPSANRTLNFRSLKEVETTVPISIVNWFMGADGWTLATCDGSAPDRVYNAEFLHNIYTTAKPDFSGRVTVPVLRDKQTDSIVSSESADTIPMFNSAHDEVGVRSGDYYPQAECTTIDRLNTGIYGTIKTAFTRRGLQPRLVNAVG